jgi:hypothetical protein
LPRGFAAAAAARTSRSATARTRASVFDRSERVAIYGGFGRLAATWDMTEELPDAFRDKTRACDTVGR